MTALVYLKSGQLEVIEHVVEVAWGEYRVRLSKDYGLGEDAVYSPHQVVKVELVP